MATLDLKQSVLAHINNADEKLLRLIQALAESYQEEEIVAHTVDGKPLTQAEYQQRIMEAEAEIKNGNYITQEDLEEKVRSWGK